MNPDLKCQLFCLEFLQLHGESKARTIAMEAKACGIPGNVGRNMAQMVDSGVLRREKRAGRYAYYSLIDPIETEGLIGTLRLMEQGDVTNE